MKCCLIFYDKRDNSNENIKSLFLSLYSVKKLEIRKVSKGHGCPRLKT